MVSNSPSHYSFVFDEQSNSYNFITKNKILYTVIFISDNTFNTLTSTTNYNNTFQIVIEKISNKIEPYDVLVSKTIGEIIIRFFSSNQNALLYVCSESDRKEIKRFNAFQRWYAQSDAKNFILKMDNILSFSFDNHEQLVFTSLLIHYENSQKKELIEIYERIEDILNTDK